MKRLILAYRRNKFYARLPIESEPCDEFDGFDRVADVDLTQKETDMVERLGFEVQRFFNGRTYFCIDAVVEDALTAGIPDRTLKVLLKANSHFVRMGQIVGRIEDWSYGKDRKSKLLINALMILCTPIVLPDVLSFMIPMLIITKKYSTNEDNP